MDESGVDTIAKKKKIKKKGFAFVRKIYNASHVISMLLLTDVCAVSAGVCGWV